MKNKYFQKIRWINKTNKNSNYSQIFNGPNQDLNYNFDNNILKNDTLTECEDQANLMNFIFMI